jgi:UPF0755 protein
MTKIKKIALIVVVAILLSIVTFWAWLHFSLQEESRNSNAEYVEVNSGDTLSKLCQRMKQEGIFSHCLALKVKAKISSQLASIQKGVYLLEPNTPILDFIAMVNNGSEVQFSFTIVEGDNQFQVFEKIKQKAYLVDDVTNLSNKELAEKLKLESPRIEGWLYPDTYHYSANSTALELLKRAVAKQQQVLETEWELRAEDIGIDSPYQALILASIVEKESSVSAERPLIASVFHNRLQKKMRLQTDPTVIYGVWHEYKGDITSRHLREKTPYNTYRINGLTPTPIANPSLASIKAVLNPAKSQYFYFVASGNGDHVFSRTLDEHNRAVRNYLRKQRINKLKG